MTERYHIPPTSSSNLALVTGHRRGRSLDPVILALVVSLQNHDPRAPQHFVFLTNREPFPNKPSHRQNPLRTTNPSPTAPPPFDAPLPTPYHPRHQITHTTSTSHPGVKSEVRLHRHRRRVGRRDPRHEAHGRPQHLGAPAGGGA